MPIVTPIRAAQYLRMSTEHQQYSTENQASSIEKYAQDHCFHIIQTYVDAAKSGLSLKDRPGLRALLQDVTAGKTDYKAILVYDVSRWGRFQDTDEAAHYEFVCRSSGILIHYCAETFSNDGSFPSSIMKALKRAMAAEYSRELGVKVFAGQKRLAELGFKQGGPPGLGFRRMLVSPERKPKRRLVFGDRKSIATDRVVLVPGPAAEIEDVREIYRMYTVKKMTLRGIAEELNRIGIPSAKKGQWTHTVVARLLSHPKYIGCNVFNQSTARLGIARIARPRGDWIISEGAHQGIVDLATYARAQEMLGDIGFRRTNERILRELRSLLDSKGLLSPRIIDSDLASVSAATVQARFGSLRRAYELIGYKCRAPKVSRLDPKPKVG